MAKYILRAPVPTPKEVAERDAIRAQNRADARNAAEPGVTPDRSEPDCICRYRIIGPRKVCGKGKGEVVMMPCREAASLIEAGHIEPVVNNDKAAMERPKKGASHG